MKDNKLEVGDEIYSKGGFSRDSYHIHGKIDRITKTMFFIDGKKFRRELSPWGQNIVDTIPRQTGYHTRTYMLLTDKVRKDIEKQEARDAKEIVLYKWGSSNFNGAVRNLSDDKLNRIVEILEEK